MKHCQVDDEEPAAKYREMMLAPRTPKPWREISKSHRRRWRKKMREEYGQG